MKVNEQDKQTYVEFQKVLQLTYVTELSDAHSKSTEAQQEKERAVGCGVVRTPGN